MLGEALSNLSVGLLRRARDEKLAAMRMVQVYAVDRILEFIELRRTPSALSTVSRDPFSIKRRIEARIPEIRDAIPVWTGGYFGKCQAAIALLDVLEEHAQAPTKVSAYIRSLANLNLQFRQSSSI